MEGERQKEAIEKTERETEREKDRGEREEESGREKERKRERKESKGEGELHLDRVSVCTWTTGDGTCGKEAELCCCYYRRQLQASRQADDAPQLS